jgi:predicted TIM-barrel fold metal-dependent hydrolase
MDEAGIDLQVILHGAPSAQKLDAETAVRLARGANDRLAQAIAAHPDPALLCCVQELGVDRIMFSVDWPFVDNMPAVDWMRTVSLCKEDKAKILSGNAERILRL